MKIILCLLVFAIPITIISHPAALCPDNASEVEGVCLCRLNTVKFFIKGVLICEPCKKCEKQIQSHRCNNVTPYREFAKVTCLDECPSGTFIYQGTCKPCESPCDGVDKVNEWEIESCVGGKNRVCVCKKPYYRAYSTGKCTKKCSLCPPGNRNKKVPPTECLDFPENQRCIEETTTTTLLPTTVRPRVTFQTITKIKTTKFNSVNFTGNSETTVLPDNETTILPDNETTATTDLKTTAPVTTDLKTTAPVTTDLKTTAHPVTTDHITTTPVTTDLKTTVHPVTKTNNLTLPAGTDNEGESSGHFTVFYICLIGIFILLLIIAVMVLIWHSQWRRRTGNASVNSSVAGSPLMKGEEIEIEEEHVRFYNTSSPANQVLAGPSFQLGNNLNNNGNSEPIELSTEITDCVCLRLNKDCEKLANELIENEQDREDVLSKVYDNVYDKAHAVIKKWQESLKTTPTWDKLEYALQSIPRYDIVRAVEQKLSEDEERHNTKASD